MHSDGQLYDAPHKKRDIKPPPLHNMEEPACEEICIPSKKGGLFSDTDTLLILGLVLILVTDRCKTDIPLVIALLYILFSAS